MQVRNRENSSQIRTLTWGFWRFHTCSRDSNIETVASFLWAPWASNITYDAYKALSLLIPFRRDHAKRRCYEAVSHRLFLDLSRSNDQSCVPSKTSHVVLNRCTSEYSTYTQRTRCSSPKIFLDEFPLKWHLCPGLKTYIIWRDTRVTPYPTEFITSYYTWLWVFWLNLTIKTLCGVVHFVAYSHSTYLSHSLCAVQPFIATIFFKFFSDSSKLSHNSPVVSAAKKNLKTVQMSQK